MQKSKKPELETEQWSGFLSASAEIFLRGSAFGSGAPREKMHKKGSETAFPTGKKKRISSTRNAALESTGYRRKNDRRRHAYFSR